jgi:hypothetical protein
VPAAEYSWDVRRIQTIIAFTITALLALSGCSQGVQDPTPDRVACETWANGEKSMLQMVSLIATMSKDSGGLTEDALTAFNGARNTLLTAYETASKTAESETIKDALNKALDADSVVYYDLAGATTERMQDSINAVSAVIAACATTGVDLTSIFNSDK